MRKLKTKQSFRKNGKRTGKRICPVFQKTEQRLAGAQYKLGVMNVKAEGVPKDDVEAYAWFLLTKSKGYEESSEGIYLCEKVFIAE